MPERPGGIMTHSDIALAIQRIIEVFGKLGIQYYISGSVASSNYGAARSTLDVDMVSDLQLHHVPLLIEELQHEYYISEIAIREALQRQSSFNLIHLDTMMKVDVFILRNLPHDQAAFQRKREDHLIGHEEASVFLGTAEDIVLHKLVWFEQGKRVSEQQWKDILSILRLQGDRTDWDYLEHWVGQLEITDVWKQVLDEL